MRKMSSRSSVYCCVPLCKNTVKNSNKAFFTVPSRPEERRQWLKAMRRRLDDVSPKSCLRICEDHFNLEEDMVNYMKFKFGATSSKRLKPGVVPHIFACQPEKPKREKPNAIKRSPFTTPAFCISNDEKISDGSLPPVTLLHQRKMTNEEKTLRDALIDYEASNDRYFKFSLFVANEIRSLKYEDLKLKLEKQICKAILDVYEVQDTRTFFPPTE